MLVLKALEAFQLVGAIFGLLQVTRWSCGRSIRELPGDKELSFEDPVPRMNVHVPFAAAMMCGRGRSSGRGTGVVVATMPRN